MLNVHAQYCCGSSTILEPKVEVYMAMSPPTQLRVKQCLHELPHHRIKGISVDDVCGKMASKFNRSATKVREALIVMQRDGDITAKRDDDGVVVTLTDQGETRMADQQAKFDHEKEAAEKTKATAAAVTSNGSSAALRRGGDTYGRGLGKFTRRKPESQIQPRERHLARDLRTLVEQRGGMMVGDDLTELIVSRMPALEPDEVLTLCRHMASDEQISIRTVKGELKGVSFPNQTLELHAAVDALLSKPRARAAASA